MNRFSVTHYIPLCRLVKYTSSFMKRRLQHPLKWIRHPFEQQRRIRLQLELRVREWFAQHMFVVVEEVNNTTAMYQSGQEGVAGVWGSFSLLWLMLKRTKVKEQATRMWFQNSQLLKHKFTRKMFIYNSEYRCGWQGGWAAWLVTSFWVSG